MQHGGAGTHHGAACTSGGAFATFISGTKYVAGVRCLAASLAAAGTSCPLAIVHDDRPGYALPLREVEDLASDPRRVPWRLTALFSRLNTTGHRPAFYGRDYVAKGRRLYERHEYDIPWLKLWVWALPYPVIFFLDADMLVLTNLEHLLDSAALAAASHEKGGRRPSAGVAASGNHSVALWAIDASTSCPRARLPPFNSGAMVLYPSMSVLADLQRLALDWWRRIGTGKWKPLKACESRTTDQTLLNAYFQSRWSPLPPTARVADAREWGAMLLRQASPQANASLAASGDGSNALGPPAVAHFSAEPKPWVVWVHDVWPRSLDPVRHRAFEAWAEMCLEPSLGNGRLNCSQGAVHRALACGRLEEGI